MPASILVPNTGINVEENQITEKIIGCSYQVINTLGAGFLEKVYENALVYELRKCGLKTSQQQPIPVYYDGQIVGEYFADILVADTIIVELKTVQALDKVHEAQCLNYLRATGLNICLLLNFARSRLEVCRLINTPPGTNLPRIATGRINPR